MGWPLRSPGAVEGSTRRASPRRERARWVLHGPRGTAEVHGRGAIGSDDITFVRRAALAGAGITLLPEIVGERLTSSGALQRVLPEYSAPQSPLYIVTQRRRSSRPAWRSSALTSSSTSARAPTPRISSEATSRPASGRSAGQRADKGAGT